MMRRRYASYTKRGLPVFLTKPGIVAEQRPMLRTVSIIPGIELLAPERQEMRSGFSLSPNFMFITSSVLAIAALTSSNNGAGYSQLFL